LVSKIRDRVWEGGNSWKFNFPDIPIKNPDVFFSPKFRNKCCFEGFEGSSDFLTFQKKNMGLKKVTKNCPSFAGFFSCENVVWKVLKDP